MFKAAIFPEEPSQDYVTRHIIWNFHPVILCVLLFCMDLLVIVPTCLWLHPVYIAMCWWAFPGMESQWLLGSRFRNKIGKIPKKTWPPLKTKHPINAIIPWKYTIKIEIPYSNLINAYPVNTVLISDSYSKNRPWHFQTSQPWPDIAAQGGSGLANLRRVVVQFADLASWAQERKREFAGRNWH